MRNLVGVIAETLTHLSTPFRRPTEPEALHPVALHDVAGAQPTNQLVRRGVLRAADGREEIARQILRQPFATHDQRGFRHAKSARSSGEKNAVVQFHDDKGAVVAEFAREALKGYAVVSAIKMDDGAKGTE